MNLYESVKSNLNESNPYVENIAKKYGLDYVNADIMTEYIDFIDDYILGEGYILTKDGISDVFEDLFDDGREPPKEFNRKVVEEALYKYYADDLAEGE